MVLLGFLLFLFGYLFLQLVYTDPAKKEIISEAYKENRNYTLAYVIPEEVIDTWLKEIPHVEQREDPSLLRKRYVKTRVKDKNKSKILPSDCPKECILESMFTPPLEKVEIDWAVVLGTYSHYHDENWKEFLIKTGAPLFVRLLVENMSETVTFLRTPIKKKKEKKLNKSKEYKISLQTTLWLFTHTSEFKLEETIIEHDIDGSDSENIFFFPAPRILVHNKYKEKGNVSIVYNFDEVGLNMTLISRDKFIVSRRMFNRVQD